MQVRIKNLKIDKYYVFNTDDNKNIEEFIEKLNEICIDKEFDFRIASF